MVLTTHYACAYEIRDALQLEINCDQALRNAALPRIHDPRFGMLLDPTLHGNNILFTVL